MSEHSIEATVEVGDEEIDVVIRYGFVQGAPDTRDDPGWGDEVSFISAVPDIAVDDDKLRALQHAAAKWLDENRAAAIGDAEQDREPDPDEARDRAIEDRMMDRGRDRDDY